MRLTWNGDWRVEQTDTMHSEAVSKHQLGSEGTEVSLGVDGALVTLHTTSWCSLILAECFIFNFLGAFCVSSFRPK